MEKAPTQRSRWVGGLIAAASARLSIFSNYRKQLPEGKSQIISFYHENETAGVVEMMIARQQTVFDDHLKQRGSRKEISQTGGGKLKNNNKNNSET